MSNKVPKIRFKGFDNEWEEGLLKDMASFDKGQGYSKNDLKASGNPIILYGRLYTNFQSVISKVDTFADIKDSSIFSKGGEVIVPASGECPEDIARASVVKEKHVILGGDVNIVSPNEKIDSLFLALNITYGSAHMKLAQQSQGATISHLHNGDIQKVNISFPSKKTEQSKIGSYFEQLDALIEGKQKKLEKLKNLKKAYLDKMFPKKGAKVPEVRFKGFSDDWENQKLENYLTICDQINSNNDFGPKEVLSVSGDYGVVNQIEFQGRSFAGANLLKYRVAATGTVIYTKSPLKANPYGIIKANKGATGIVSVLYAVYNTKENANANFIQTYFEKTPRLNAYLRTLVNKGAKNTLLISDEEALQGLVAFPSVEEQTKIADFFKNLDSLISLQQQELEKLKNIKSACLQKMFV